MQQPKGKRKYLEKKAIALLGNHESIAATAEKLGIYRSTLHRWLKKADFVAAVAEAKEKSPQTEARAAAQAEPDSFEGWVRSRHQLTPAEEQILELAVESLEMSRNLLLPEKVRLQAMGRFQSLLKDMNLVSGEGQGEKGKRQSQRPAGQVKASRKDPRGVLGVVNQ